mgnify:CR=1 FL=1
MTAPAPAWLDRYPHDRALRRRAEVSFWAVVLLVQATFNTVVTRIELRSAGRTVAAWEPLLWELTSALVVLLTVPFALAAYFAFTVHSHDLVLSQCVDALVFNTFGVDGHDAPDGDDLELSYSI